MSRFAHFNISETTTIVCGVPITDGKAAEPFLSFEFPDDWETEESADGLVLRCKTNNALVKCDVTLKGASTDIDKLMAVRNADILAGGGAGVGRFFYKDDNGTTVINASRNWIMKVPNFTVGRKRGDVVFNTLMVVDGPILLGGNSVT